MTRAKRREVEPQPLALFINIDDLGRQKRGLTEQRGQIRSRIRDTLHPAEHSGLARQDRELERGLKRIDTELRSLFKAFALNHGTQPYWADERQLARAALTNARAQEARDAEEVRQAERNDYREDTVGSSRRVTVAKSRHERSKREVERLSQQVRTVAAAQRLAALFDAHLVDPECAVCTSPAVEKVNAEGPETARLLGFTEREYAGHREKHWRGWQTRARGVRVFIDVDGNEVGFAAQERS